MKRVFVIAIIFCFSVIPVAAQKTKTPVQLTESQWQGIFTALRNENWTAAFNLSGKYLKQLKDNDKAKSIANLRYIYLYAAAGKVSEGTMSFAEIAKYVKTLIGKKVVMPYRQIAQECQGSFNFICPTDAKNKAIVAAANKKGTTVHSFEYIQLKENLDFAKHEGEKAAIAGVIRSIVPKPNKSKLIILRIYISDGYLIFSDPQMKKASVR
jgi:hypothetical protein